MVLKIGVYRQADQKYLENFEMWSRRRMQKISWTDCVKYEEVLHGVKEERNIVQTIKRMNFVLSHSRVLNCTDIQGVPGGMGQTSGECSLS
jgi:hypothetical protein